MTSFDGMKKLLDEHRNLSKKREKNMGSLLMEKRGDSSEL
jgi:hypothetical protein